MSGVTVLGSDRGRDRTRASVAAGVVFGTRAGLSLVVAGTRRSRPGVPAIASSPLAFSPGPVVSLRAVVRQPDGAFRRIAIGAADPRSDDLVARAAPRRASGARRLEIVPRPGSSSAGPIPDDALVATFASAGSRAARLVGVGGVVTIDAHRSRFALPSRSSQNVSLRSPQPTDVSPAVGARDPAARRARRWRRWRAAAPARRATSRFRWPGSSSGSREPRATWSSATSTSSDRGQHGLARRRAGERGLARRPATGRTTVAAALARPPFRRSRRRCGARSRPRHTTIRSATERCSR